MYNHGEKIAKMCTLCDHDKKAQKQERTRPSVERRRTSSEKRYNEFVKQLYKSKKNRIKARTTY